MESKSILRFQSKLFSFLLIASILSQAGFTTTILAKPQADPDPIPHIEVNPYLGVNAVGWPIDTEVTMTIDDPSNGLGTDYTASATMEITPWAMGEAYDIKAFFPWPAQFTPGPGYWIEMMGENGQSNAYTVADLKVTNFDLDNDTVSGIATPNTVVHVGAGFMGHGSDRWVTSDSSGNWTVDYQHIGSPSENQETVDIRGGTNGWSVIYGIDSNLTWFGWQIDWDIENPHMWIGPYSNDGIKVFDWPLGNEITMTIHDPSSGMEYSDTATMEPAPWNPDDPNDILAIFQWPDQFTPGPGYIITMSGENGQSETYTVANLKVTDIDLNSDTISGTASPNAEVQVCANFPDSCAKRYVTADSSGNWTADYQHTGARGDEQEIFDLQPGSNGWADEYGNDGNRTWFDWWVPVPQNPTIWASQTLGKIFTFGWPSDATLHMCIDDDSNPSDDGCVMEQTWSDYDMSFWDWYFEGLQPDWYVNVSGGGYYRQMQLTDLRVMEVDDENDRVIGHASNLDRPIWIEIGENNGRLVYPDSTGRWEADFSVSGPLSEEQFIVNLGPGARGAAQQPVGNGDWNFADWMNEGYVDWGVLASDQAGPFNMAFDTAGNLYVANEDGGSGTQVMRIRPDGDVRPFADGFGGVSGLAMRSDGVLLASDDTNRVFEIDPDGNVSVLIDATAGLENPNALAVDSLGYIYVVSAGGFVSKFDPDGNLLVGRLLDGLDTPEGAAIDNSARKLFVSDAEGTIFEVNLDTGQSQVLTSVMIFKRNDGGLALDNDGYLYLPNNSGDIIKVNTDGGGYSYCLRGLDSPRGLAINSAGRILVTSSNSGLVLRASGCGTTQPPTELASQSIWASQADGIIYTSGWPSDATLHVCIDNDSDPDNDGCLMEQTYGNPDDDMSFWDWYFEGLQPGWYVNVGRAGEGYDKQLQLTGVIMEGVTNDNVFGHTIDTYAPIWIEIGENNGRWIMPNGDGSWNADFTESGPLPEEKYAVHLEPGAHGQAQQPEGDGDWNFDYWQVDGPVDWEVLAADQAGPFNLAFDAAGNLYVANEDGGNGTQVMKITPEGVVSIFADGFGGVSGLAMRSDGVLLASDDTNRVFEIDPDGNISVLIDENAGLANPNALAVDSLGNIYVVSAGGFVSKFDPDGNPLVGRLLDGLDTPQGIAIDESTRRVFVSDRVGKIYEVNMDTGQNQVLTFVDTFMENDGGLAIYDGYLYLSNTAGDIIKVNTDGGGYSYCLGGLDSPRGLAIDSAGRILVTSYNLGLVLRASGCGTVGTTSYTSDGENITINSPAGEASTTFDQVTQNGETVILPVAEGSAPVPHSFQVLGTPYLITTTATFTSALVCLAYNDDGLILQAEQALRLYHFKDGEWENVTDLLNYPDTVNNLVCGNVTSFSPFAIMFSTKPTITSITAPISPVQMGTMVNVSAAFTDPGTADTFTAVWTWDDTTNSSGTVTNHIVTGSHLYTAPGVYTVKLTVTDNDGGVGTSTYQYVVVYDPTGGFVTGGGWFIDDPVTGSKAHFGFNPKYQPNTTIPKGETEFKLDGLKFKSTSHDWLVINGTKAQFKGSGTINGAGDYGFLVSVIDGSPDKIRIKIWNKGTGVVEYDNLTGAPDYADPLTEIGGGSIQVHAK